MNKIEKKEFSEDDWELIIDDMETLGEMEHRRGQTFYVAPQYIITEGMFPDRPELWGRWESDILTWSDDWGLDGEPDTLYRIEERERTVIVKEWVRV